MESNTKKKIFYFVAVLAFYFFVVGSDLDNRMMRRPTYFFVTAAVLAFWVGREPFGVYQKISVRPICIWVGTFMMVVMFILMLFLKEALHHYDKTPNK